MPTHVGVAGWSIPSMLADRFPAQGTHLERYGTRLLAVEINTSFYRPHRRTTYERWAASVPATFRFAVKLPRTITHERRLINCHDLMERFAGETAGLSSKRGPILVQLPPSFAWPGEEAERFFYDLKAMIDSAIVVEPRHASWFAPQVEAMLVRQQVARVAADPARIAGAGQPGGWRALAYFRLHGAPRMYESPYTIQSIAAQAHAVAALEQRGVDVWTIYDNTTFGAATRNALELGQALGGDGSGTQP